ncbi:hypothetical protein Tco_1463335 [Tanacetum coccineum]
MTNKIDTVLKAITDQITRAVLSDTVKNPKLNVSTSRSFVCSFIPMDMIPNAGPAANGIDYRKAKIVVGEVITRLVFRVKRIELGEEEAPHWTILGKRESYKPRPSSDSVGAQTPYYAKKEFMDFHLPGEWEIAKDAEINPFKDVLIFRRMVEFLGAISINIKRNMWELEDLIKNPINWDKPPKNGDGAWHA